MLVARRGMQSTSIVSVDFDKFQIRVVRNIALQNRSNMCGKCFRFSVLDLATRNVLSDF